MSTVTTARDVLFGSQPNHEKSRDDLMTGLGGMTTTLSPLIPMREAVDAVWELLDLPLADVMRGAWDKNDQVQRAKANTRGKVGSIEQVSFKSHTIRSQHRPKIEFEGPGVSIPAFQFDLALALKLDAAVVTVANGAISAIAPGSGSAEGSLAIGGKKLVDHKLARVALPDTIRFGEVEPAPVPRSPKP